MPLTLIYVSSPKAINKFISTEELRPSTVNSTHQIDQSTNLCNMEFYLIITYIIYSKKNQGLYAFMWEYNLVDIVYFCRYYADKIHNLSYIMKSRQKRAVFNGSRAEFAMEFVSISQYS